jgi:hypothetical protein
MAPVAIPLVVVTPTLALSLPVAAVSVPLAIAAPSLALTRAVAAVPVPIVVTAAAMSLVVGTVPVAIPIVVALETVRVIVLPNPAGIPIVVVTPSINVGGISPIDLAMMPLTIPLVVKTPFMLLVVVNNLECVAEGAMPESVVWPASSLTSVIEQEVFVQQVLSDCELPDSAIRPWEV